MKTLSKIGKAQVIERRKAIGSLNRIAWPQKGEKNGYYPINNLLVCNYLVHISGLSVRPKKHQTQAKKKEIYYIEAEKIRDKNLIPFSHKMGCYYIPSSVKQERATS